MGYQKNGHVPDVYRRYMTPKGAVRQYSRLSWRQLGFLYIIMTFSHLYISVRYDRRCCLFGYFDDIDSTHQQLAAILGQLSTASDVQTPAQ